MLDESYNELYRPRKDEVISTDIVKDYEEHEIFDLLMNNYRENTTMTTDKLTRQLTKIENLTNFKYLASNKKSEGFVFGSVTYDIIQKNQPTISNWDALIIEGASRLWDDGVTEFTPKMLYRSATGQRHSEAKGNQLESVLESVRRLSSMLLRVNLKADYDNLYKKGDIAEIEENILMISRVSLRNSDGKILDGYKLYKKPAIKRYAKEINNITQVPNKLLDIGSSIEDALILHHLAKRIREMQNKATKKNTSTGNKITIESILTASDIDVNDATDGKVRNIRKKVESFLKTWVDMGFIKAFNEYKRGRKIIGYEINSKPQKKIN